MKKIFTLFVALIALTFCAKAQVTIILEAHDVWQDGSGYQLLLDADHNTYGTVIPATGPLTTSGDAPASVYAEFEYKVPVNADGSLTTTNIVMDGTATITIPAGIYDFCITNPTPGDKVWIAGDGIDPTRGDDYEFLDGRTYHFLIARNGDYDGCTMTVTFNPTEPTISATPSTVNFGNVTLGTTADRTVTVTNYLLTAAVTATTTAPFAISTDGNNFGTTATIPQTGGTLHVRYTPTATGTDNGNITLASTGANNVTVTLTGSGLDCSNITIPFTEGFESSIDCWTMVSVDPANDAEFGVFASPSAYEGNNNFQFSSYSSASDYNQYLITPQLTLNANENYLFKFYYKGYNANENFRVMYSTTNNTPSSFTELANYTNVATTWTEAIHQLPAGTKYVAINYYGNYQYYLYVDNISVVTASPNMTLSTHAVDLGYAPAGVASNSQAVTMTTINVNEPFTLTTAAPFEISLDGNSFATTQTIPASTDMVNNSTFYVRFAPTTVGNFSQELYVTSTNFSDTITLVGEAIDCNTTLPYATNFDNEGQNLCWSIVDANNDGRTFNFNLTDSCAYYQYSSSNVADDWLISPVFTLTGAQYCYLDYSAYSSSYSEKFQVFAIDANNNNTALTGVIETNNTAYQTQVIDLTSLTGSYRIGIHCISEADMFYLRIRNFNVNNNVPAASLTVTPDALDFGTIPAGNTSMAKMVVMNTINVNEAITLTVSAPYEISLDGANFAATQTIPANAALVVNDSVYVRFVPTAAGTFSQSIAISSASQNATIALNGAAVDCAGEAITTFPFLNDFNTGFPVCWGYNDPDNFFTANVDEAGTDKAVGFQGLDMLVTPEITSNSPMAVMFGYRGYLGNNLEGMDPTTFRVGYSTTNSDAASFTWFETVNVNDYPADGTIFFDYINTIPANTKYVAIDVTYLASLATLFGTYDDVVYIDNFRLVTDGDIYVTPESMNFGSAIAGTATAPKTATISTALLTSDINVTAPANFEVSANGGTYAATATIPQAGGTLYVRYNPAAPGNHSGNVTLTSGTITKNIAVSGSAIDCSQPKTLPFSEDFENGMPACWRILDQDGDGYSWESSFEPVSYYPSDVDLSGSGNNGSDGFVLSGSYSNVNGVLYPDNWLITPALVIPSNGAKLTWYVTAADANYAEEYYEVMLSTSLDPSSFTSVFNETLQSNEWEQRSVNISGNYAGQNVYVAFRNYNTSDIFLMKIDDINVTAGVGVENHETNVSIYPNPANNVLNINANENINRVEVFNIMGQMVGSYDANDTYTQINTTTFANGVYTVKVETENGTMTQKFTVAR